MNALKAIEVINAAADLQEEVNEVNNLDVEIVGINITNIHSIASSIQIFSGIEKLAKELNVELLFQEETDEFFKSRYFIHRGIRIFQIDV